MVAILGWVLIVLFGPAVGGGKRDFAARLDEAAGYPKGTTLSKLASSEEESQLGPDKPDFTPWMIKGPDARRERQLPQVVAVIHDNMLCTGVVIAPDFVLTAAHCHVSKGDIVYFDDDVGHESPNTRKVAEARENSGPDAAILLLDRPTNVSLYPFQLSSIETLEDLEVTLVGYGRTNDGTFGRRMAVRVKTDRWKCDGKRSERYGCKPGLEMVIKDSRLNDTCNGDSGGPVFADIGGVKTIVAITSRAVEPKDGSVDRCGPGGIYVRVDAISSWITDTILQFKDRRSAMERER